MIITIIAIIIIIIYILYIYDIIYIHMYTHTHTGIFHLQGPHGASPLRLPSGLVGFWSECKTPQLHRSILTIIIGHFYLI